MVVWAESPSISERMPNGRADTISQMKELIVQNYNHASIVCWGVSDEITVSTRNNCATSGTTTASSTISATRWTRPA